MYFRYFKIISPWKREEAFIWRYLKPLHPRMLCAKFGWNMLSGSWEEKFLISSMYFQYFKIIYPWKGRGPSFEQTWIPFTKYALRQVWLKLAQWFLRRRWNCEKFTDGGTDRQRDSQTDNGQQVISKAHLSFQLNQIFKFFRQCIFTFS